MLTEVISFVPFLYEDEGVRFAEQLWEETMSELRFANPKDMLGEMAEKKR